MIKFLNGNDEKGKTEPSIWSERCLVFLIPPCKQ